MPSPEDGGGGVTAFPDLISYGAAVAISKTLARQAGCFEDEAPDFIEEAAEILRDLAEEGFDFTFGEDEPLFTGDDDDF